MKSMILFAGLFLSLSLFGQKQKQLQTVTDVTSAEYKDPFLVMQWILKDPKGKYVSFTESFMGDDGVTYYFLPKKFWADTSQNQEIKEMLKVKFLQLYLPYAQWAQNVSGVEYVFFLTVAIRESTMATSEHYVRSGGELFSIKLKDFQTSVGFVKGFYFVDNGKREFFVQMSFGKNYTTLQSFKLLLLSITQKHYIKRLEDKGDYMLVRVNDWKKGNFPQVTLIVYTPEQYLNCLCGYSTMNWAENCGGYEKTLAAVRARLVKIK